MKVKDVKDIIKNIRIDAYSNEDLEEYNSEVKNTEEDKYNVKDMLISALENVEAHEQNRTIHESVVTPEHEERKESTDFKKAKKRLKDDGHYKCWVCGSTNNLQAHHYAAEWSLADCVDFDKLKAFCEEWDPYGYGKLLKDTPITSVNDVRNMLILCQTHHTGVDHENDDSGTGIHSLSFSAFIIQKIAKDGENPIPQPGQDADDMIKLAEEEEKLPLKK